MAASPLNAVARHLRPADPATDRELLHRYLAGRDEAAFEALVRRHERAVLAACRQVLSDPADAADAFQATFLVLLRKADRVAWRPSLGGWLYAVAHRVAVHARKTARRRKAKEAAAAVESTASPPDVSWREACLILHEELDRLPDSYRLPLLLCYLRGLSRDEAAAQLGWSVGSVRGRLDRGREALRRRLTRRGVTLSAGLLAAVDAPADVPPTLVPSTLAAAAAGPTPAVAALARGAASGTPWLVKALAAAVLVAAAVGLAGFAGQKDPDPPKPAADKPAPPAAEKPADGTTFTYAGKVLGPDGKPLPGAKVLICGLKPGVIEYAERATAGPDGTFRFTVRRDEFGEKGVVPPHRSPPERFVHLAASTDGYGSATAWASKPEDREAAVIRLPAEEPVKGRVVSLEGKPVAGVKVSAYIRAAQWDQAGKPIPYDAPDTDGGRSSNVAPFDQDRHSATTDADGRFTLRGLGRGWLYGLYISGPTIVSAKAELVARPQKPATTPATGLAPPDRRPPTIPLYGSEFTHVAPPCKPIRGVVREKGSGKALAGARVYTPFTRDDDPQASATTDAGGKYELTGLPRGNYSVRVDPPANTPYLETEFQVEADDPGTEPVTADLEVERQPAATGRVTDAATGKPVGGWVEYRPLAANPNLGKNPLLAGPLFRQRVPSARLDKDGRFTLPVLPGPGVLLVQAEGDYRPARLAKADRLEKVAVKEDPELIDSRPFPAWPATFHAYRLIDVTAGKDVEVSVTLTPDRVRPLVVEFPGGKPQDLAAVGLKPATEQYGEGVFAGTPAVVRGLADGEKRRVFLSTHDAKYAAVVTVKEGDGPVPVPLRPTGTVTGRLLDKDGRPVKGVAFKVLYDDGGAGVMIHGGATFRAPTAAMEKRLRLTTGYYADKMGRWTGPEQTDEAGRFRIPGLVPSAAFDLHAQVVAPPDPKGARMIRGYVKVGRATVEPGQTADLGDLTLTEPAKK